MFSGSRPLLEEGDHPLLGGLGRTILAHVYADPETAAVCSSRRSTFSRAAARPSVKVSPS